MGVYPAAPVPGRSSDPAASALCGTLGASSSGVVGTGLTSTRELLDIVCWLCTGVSAGACPTEAAEPQPPASGLSPAFMAATVAGRPSVGASLATEGWRAGSSPKASAADTRAAPCSRSAAAAAAGGCGGVLAVRGLCTSASQTSPKACTNIQQPETAPWSTTIAV